MILNKIDFIKILEENTSTKIENVTLDDRLDELGLDSLGFATLLFSLEDYFNVKIEESKLQGLGGTSSLREFVQRFQELGFEIKI